MAVVGLLREFESPAKADDVSVVAVLGSDLSLEDTA